ncbi:MAG: DNA polymerase III subunit delta' [Rhodothalassiaceae bacterium]
MARSPAKPDPSSESDPFDPLFTPHVIGHEAAERTFLEAMRDGRLHHAWLIAGPRGVGKATFALAAARSLLAHARDADAGPSLFGEAPALPDRLGIAAEDPLFLRIAHGGHGNLLLVRRGEDERKKALNAEIRVDEIRRIQDFFARTAAESGPRIAIVDAADEMNRNAANALLKSLEEPPPGAILFLIGHQPGRLLATIRSRCRLLRLRPLPDERVREILLSRLPDMAEEDIAGIVRLADGSPGRAVSLARRDALRVYRQLIAMLSNLPGLDIPEAHGFAQALSARTADEDFRLFAELFTDFIAATARAAARAGTDAARAGEAVAGEAALIARLAPALSLDHWVELWEKTARSIARADAIHLDRKQLVLSLLSMMDEAARGRVEV